MTTKLIPKWCASFFILMTSNFNKNLSIESFGEIDIHINLAKDMSFPPPWPLCLGSMYRVPSSVYGVFTKCSCNEWNSFFIFKSLE